MKNSFFFMVCPPGLEPGPGASEALMVSNSTTGTFCIFMRYFQKFSKIITLEDGTIQGGLGSAVAEFMADHQYHATIKRLGIPDKFIEHGTQQQLYEECGFDEKSITRCIQEMLIEKDTRE